MAARSNYIPETEDNVNKYVVFYCSKFCKNSLEIIDYMKKNVNKLNECQMIQLFDIAELIESGNNIPSYVKYIPAIVICDEITNSIQSDDDIIFGSANVIKCLNSIISKFVKKASYSTDSKSVGVDKNNMHKLRNSDWTKNIIEIKSKEDVPISTNIFAEKCGNKRNDKKIDYSSAIKEREELNKELGIKEVAPKKNEPQNNKTNKVNDTENKGKRKIIPSNNSGGASIRRK
jgi:hypothetical protein